MFANVAKKGTGFLSGVVAVMTPPRRTAQNVAQRGMTLVGVVVGVAVAAIVAFSLLPVALDMYDAVVITTWDAPVQAIWGLLPILIIIGVALWFFKGAGADKG